MGRYGEPDDAAGLVPQRTPSRLDRAFVAMVRGVGHGLAAIAILIGLGMVLGNPLPGLVFLAAVYGMIRTFRIRPQGRW